ncbi:hypothetical protein [Halomonas sp. C05BenzN]|uniref:hypothetical protein n=1 Tax=Halomonas sp. C05BenzN TaxID=3411041 RepID=UPI003B945549
MALALVPVAAEAVNKCEIDGRTVYQSAPCPAGAEVAPLEGTVSSMAGGTGGASASSALVPGGSLAERRIARERAAAQRQRVAANRRYEQQQRQEEARRQARRSGMVAEGMSERDAVRMYGSPDSTSVSQSGGRTCKHLRWRQPYRTVMVCGGEVKRSYTQ